jgi:phosphate transport system permease protein
MAVLTDTPKPVDGMPTASRTHLPPRTNPVSAGGARHTSGGFTRVDLRNLVGALVSSVSTTTLLFGRLAPLSGPFGFVVVAYVLFLVAYAVLVSFSEDRPAVVDKVVTVLLATSAVVAGGAILSVIVFTLLRGGKVLGKTNLYVQDMSRAGPLAPLSVGGILHAIVGTLIITGISILFTVPLGLTCALFLTESRSRVSWIVRTVVDAMTALPSILAGLFIYATWILILGFPHSGLAAALAVSIMGLPIIIRASDVVLRLVPGNLREASEALGAPKWKTVWNVVLPTARPGLATASILGVARMVGETAPVLLTASFTASLNVNPLKNPMITLPLAAFEFVRSPQPAVVARGFATATVLMVLVLILFAGARVAGGKGSRQATGRRARRISARSARDLERFERKPKVDA